MSRSHLINTNLSDVEATRSRRIDLKGKTATRSASPTAGSSLLPIYEMSSSHVSKEAQRVITVKHRHGWLLARIGNDTVRQMRKTDLEADIRVVKDGKEYKLGPASKPLILKLLALSAEEGDELEVFAEGPDAEEALEVFENTARECALYWAEKLRSDRNGGVARPSSHEDGL